MKLMGKIVGSNVFNNAKLIDNTIVIEVDCTGNVPPPFEVGNLVYVDIGVGDKYDQNFSNIPPPSKQHSHYFKDVSHLNFIDVYRLLKLYNVTDPCLQHAIKKLLVAGGRGAGKDINRDVKEAIDTLQRWQEMRLEDEQR